MPRQKQTPKRERFVEEMANPRLESQTAAAIKAGFAPASARVTASRLLTKANICDRIAERKAAAVRYADVTPEAIIGAAVQTAFSSIDDAFDEEGRFDINKARATGAIDRIKSITRTPNQFGESVRVEFYSASDARKELSSYMGLETMPKPNVADINHRHKAIETVLARIMRDKNATRAEAVEAMVFQVVPDDKEVRDYLMPELQLVNQQRGY